MNDTLDPEGLVPSLLVFGVLPRLPAVNSTLPEHEDRMKALRTARAEMENVVSKLRVKTALRSNIPQAAQQDILVGDEVLLHRDEQRPWTGPYRVVRVLDNQVWLRVTPQLTQQYNISQVKLYVENDADSVQDSLEQPEGPINHGTGVEPFQVHLTETIHPSDPRCFSKQFMEANVTACEAGDMLLTRMTR